MSDPMQRLEEIILKIYFDHPNIQQSDYAYMSIPKLQEAKAALLALHKETARAEMLGSENYGRVAALKDLLTWLELHDIEDMTMVQEYVEHVAESIKQLPEQRHVLYPELRQQITKRYGTEASHE